MARAWIWIMTAALVCLGGAAAAQDQPSSVALGVGTYAAAQAGAAVGGGMSAVVLRNQNGVVLELTSTQTGVKLTLAGEGIEVKLK